MDREQIIAESIAEEEIESLKRIAELYAKGAELARELIGKRNITDMKSMSQDSLYAMISTDNTALCENFFQVREELMKVHDAYGMISYNEALEARYNNFIEPYYHASFKKIDENLMLLTMPMLPKRVRYTTMKTKNDASIPKYYDTFYGRIVKEAMYFSDDSDVSFSNWSLKTLNFFFNYHDINRVIDTDSHDTKSTIDGITKAFPGGDTGLTTSVFYRTVLDQEVPELTYCFIAKGGENIVKWDDVRAYLLP